MFTVTQMIFKHSHPHRFWGWSLLSVTVWRDSVLAPPSLLPLVTPPDIQ